MVTCEKCKKEFEGVIFKWLIPYSYPNKILEPLCSECYIFLHEEQGRDISIHPDNISIYKEETHEDNAG